MSSPYPLNQAVLAQALHDLRHGQLCKARAMGFADEDLAAIKSPATASVLANATVSWCAVTINREVLRHLLHRVEGMVREVEEIDRLLRLGASTDLIDQFYGLSHQEIALRRSMLGLPQRKGRYCALSEEQDAALWRAWSAAVRQREAAPEDEVAMLGIAAELAESSDLPMSVIWGAIHQWIDGKRI